MVVEPKSVMETDVAVNEARVDDFFYRKLYLVTGGTGFLGLKLIPSVHTKYTHNTHS